MRRLILSVFMLSFLIYAKAQNANDFVNLGEDQVEQYTENQIETAQNNIEATENTINGINESIGHLNTVLSLYNDAQDLYNASQSLASGECAPDFATSENAMMSSACRSGSECEQCYLSAMRQLNFVRRQLGRLNCIYQNTKNFTNSAIAFGDNASGIHAVTGLAWQQARGEIVASMNHFKQTYDNKYIGLMGTLERALKDIDRCEAQYGQEGWYQRSGFIYFEFMKDKYKRDD